MAFLEDFGKKISNAGQSTIQKTKDAAGASKINSMISESERIINDNYNQIGKQYFSAHIDDSDCEFAEMVAVIKAEQEKIESYKEQLLALRGMTRCKGCGGEVSVNALFCSVCGTPTPKKLKQDKENENKDKCPACGGYVKKGSRFCTICGAAMQNEPTEQPEPKIVSKCPQCGFESADENNKFCNLCGAMLVPIDAEITVQEEIIPPVLEEQVEVVEKVVEPPIKKCPNCGFEISDEETLFCHECGTKLIEKQDSQLPVKKCPKCSFETTDKETLFCHECGTRLDSAVDNQLQNLRVCPKCGFGTTDDETLFCIECGTRL